MPMLAGFVGPGGAQPLLRHAYRHPQNRVFRSREQLQLRHIQRRVFERASARIALRVSLLSLRVARENSPFDA